MRLSLRSVSLKIWTKDTSILKEKKKASHAKVEQL